MSGNIPLMKLLHALSLNAEGNPNHDSDGKFSSGSGGGASAPAPKPPKAKRKIDLDEEDEDIKQDRPASAPEHRRIAGEQEARAASLEQTAKSYRERAGAHRSSASKIRTGAMAKEGSFGGALGGLAGVALSIATKGKISAKHAGTLGAALGAYAGGHHAYQNNEKKECSCKHKLVKNQLATISVNYNGKIRYEYLNGRPHMVVPVTMIVEGVLNGSKGPLYYPSSELRKDPDAWNNVPITLDHPKSTFGEPISGRNPKVIRNVGMGYVFNAKYQDGKLVAEGWFDLDRTAQVSPMIFQRLKAGRAIELSTGLFTDNEPKRGVYNGRDFMFIARNYKPDHLAVFEDKVGACSVGDGCGVLVNYNKNHDEHGRFSSGSGGGANGQVALAKATPSRSPENVHGSTFTNPNRSIKSRVAGGVIGAGVGTVAGVGLGAAAAHLGGKFIEKKLGIPAEAILKHTLPYSKTVGGWLGGAIGAGAGSISDVRPTHSDKRNLLTRLKDAGSNGVAGGLAGGLIGTGLGYASALAQGPKHATVELVRDAVGLGAKMGAKVGASAGTYAGFRGDASTKEKINWDEIRGHNRPARKLPVSTIGSESVKAAAQGGAAGAAVGVGYGLGTMAVKSYYLAGDKFTSQLTGDGPPATGLARVVKTAKLVKKYLPHAKGQLKLLGAGGAAVGALGGAAYGAYEAFHKKPTGNAVGPRMPRQQARANDGKFGTGGGAAGRAGRKALHIARRTSLQQIHGTAPKPARKFTPVSPRKTAPSPPKPGVMRKPPSEVRKDVQAKFQQAQAKVGQMHAEKAKTAQSASMREFHARKAQEHGAQMEEQVAQQ